MHTRWNPLRLSLILWGALVLIMGASALHAASGSLTISPTSGPPGTRVLASGSGFRSGEPVNLRWNAIAGSTLAQPTADSSGSFKDAAFVVPNVAPDVYNVWAIGDSSIIYTQAEFTVTAGSATSTPAPTATATPVSPTATAVPAATAPPAPGVTLLPAGAAPGGRAPVAVAVNPTTKRLYVVHRGLYRDLDVNGGLLPTDRVSVVDETTGAVITTIPVGSAVNGADQGIAVDTVRNRIYVGNADDDTVSVIDGASNRVTTTVAVGKGPTGIAVDADAGIVYIANGWGQSVTLLDAATAAVRGTVAMPGGAYRIAADPTSHLAYVVVQAGGWRVVAVDGRAGAIQGQVDINFTLSLSGIAVEPGLRAYTTDHDSGVVAVLDISGGTLREVDRWFKVALFPRGLAVDPVRHLLYVADSGNDQVSVVDTKTGNQLSPVGVLRLPSAVAADPAARRAFVTNTVSDSVSVIDLDTQAVAMTIPLGAAPFSVAFDRATKRLYTANYPTDGVHVIDPAGARVIAHWLAGAGPSMVAVDPGLGQLYTLDFDKHTVTALSTTDGKRRGSIDAGRDATIGLAVNPTTHKVYAAAGSTVTIMDGAPFQKRTTVSVGPRAAGIAVDVTGNRVYVASLGDDTIAVLDGASDLVVATLKAPPPADFYGGVWGVGVDPSLGLLYVTRVPNVIGDFSGVEVLDMASGALRAAIATGNRASQVAVNTKTHQAFVTDSADGTLSVIDGATLTLAKTVQVGSRPIGLAVDEDSGLVYVGNVLDGTIAVVDPTKIAGGAPAPAPTSGPSASPTASATAPAPGPTPCPNPSPVTGAPAPTGPANCAALTAFGTTLQWSNPVGATQFELRVLPFAADGPGLDMIGDAAGGSGSFQVLSPPLWFFLLPDMTYTWTVRTTNATTSVGIDDPRWEPWSPALTFHTPKLTSDRLTPVSPGAGGSVTSGTPTLQWQDRNPAAWYYEVQVSSDQTFETDPARATASVYWELRHGGVTSPLNSYTIPSGFPLAAGTTYYWRVRPRIQGDGTPVAWSQTWSFSVRSASQPVATATAAPAPAATATPAPTSTATPAAPLDLNAKLVGTWRVYSAALFYDDGTRGATNTAIYTQLGLRSDGTWHYSTSAGTWTVADITAGDWARWGSNPYGPTTKVVLNDWAGAGGDGPIELGTERVDFVWVIYHVEPPTVSKPGTVHLKFGHP